MSSQPPTKIVIVGDSGVGKTNLLNKYSKNKFTEDTQSTIGMEFVHKETEIDGKPIKAQFWDTAGQERFKAFGGAKAAMVVYDVTTEETFSTVSKWVSDIHDETPDIPIVIVGNKTDLTGRVVETVQGKDTAKKLKLKFFETSAKEGTNVSEAFECIMKLALEGPKEEEEEATYKPETIKMTTNDPASSQQSAGCNC